MKYYVLSLLLLATGPLCGNPEELLVDGIIAVLPHPAGDIVILASDVQMTIDGSSRTLRDVVLDGFLELKARDMNIAIPDSALEGMMAQMQKRANMTQEQFAQALEAQGFSVDEAKQMLRKRKMIAELLHILVDSRVNDPSKEEIEQYYQEHPLYEEPIYTVRLAYAPATWGTEEQILDRLAAGKLDAKITWENPETYEEENLAPEQQFITQMTIGETRIMGKTEDGYDLVQLVAKTERKLLPLNEAMVSMELREERFLKTLGDFQDEVIAKGKIRFCDPTLTRESLKAPSQSVPHPARRRAKQPSE